MIKEMKKVVYILLVPVVAILLILCTLILAKDGKRTTDITDCPNLTKQQLSSERALGLIIENRRLLAVKLGSEDEKNYSPPGGHVEMGESYAQALQRELQEEVNLKVGSADISQFRVVCEPRYGSIERTTYYLVSKWSGDISVDSSQDRLKWVNYNYSTNKRADTELKTAILALKEANLID